MLHDSLFNQRSKISNFSLRQSHMCSSYIFNVSNNTAMPYIEANLFHEQKC